MYHNSFLLFCFFMSQWLLYMRNQVICIIKTWLHFLLIWSPFSQVIFTFCMLMQLLFLLYIWFIFPGWWLLKLAAMSADTRHDTNISDTNTGQCFVLLCYLLPFTYFREESICLHRSDFVIWIFFPFFIFFSFSGLQIFCIVWESFAFSKY